MTRKTIRSTWATILRRKRWSARDAEVVLSAWRESGESLSAFAERHDLVAERLLRWRRVMTRTSIPFHPVQITAAKGDATSTSGIELVLCHGRRIEIRPGFDAALLEDLVRTVESWSC